MICTVKSKEYELNHFNHLPLSQSYQSFSKDRGHRRCPLSLNSWLVLVEVRRKSMLICVVITYYLLKEEKFLEKGKFCFKQNLSFSTPLFIIYFTPLLHKLTSNHTKYKFKGQISYSILSDSFPSSSSFQLPTRQSALLVVGFGLVVYCESILKIIFCRKIRFKIHLTNSITHPQSLT